MSELYIELQKQFINNFAPDMETARKAFEAYWETLEVCANEIYDFLCTQYNGSKTSRNMSILRDEVVEATIKQYYRCPVQFAREVRMVMCLPGTDYHTYITERQGGGIVI